MKTPKTRSPTERIKTRQQASGALPREAGRFFGERAARQKEQDAAGTHAAQTQAEQQVESAAFHSGAYAVERVRSIPLQRPQNRNAGQERKAPPSRAQPDLRKGSPPACAGGLPSLCKQKYALIRAKQQYSVCKQPRGLTVRERVPATETPKPQSRIGAGRSRPIHRRAKPEKQRRYKIKTREHARSTAEHRPLRMERAKRWYRLSKVEQKKRYAAQSHPMIDGETWKQSIQNVPSADAALPKRAPFPACPFDLPTEARGYVEHAQKTAYVPTASRAAPQATPQVQGVKRKARTLPRKEKRPGAAAFRQKPRAVFRQSCAPRQGGVGWAGEAVKAQMKRKAAQENAKKAAAVAKGTVSVMKKITVAVARAIVAIFAVAAGIISSPFGILASGESKQPGTIPVSSLVSQMNYAYARKIEEIQRTVPHGAVVLHGEQADWVDVLAVFAVKTSLADGKDAADVVVIDEARAERLRVVFWDMNHVWYKVVAQGDVLVLHIYTDSMDAEAAAAFYHFNKQQKEALDELLAYRELLQALITDVDVDDETAKDALDKLPADLSEARRLTVDHALSLVGKVHYFWGGKSSAIGWDDRWGTMRKVTAAGSPTTGTYRPYGLDCSGFVDWIFNNAMGYVIGHGGGVRMQRQYCTDIPWSEAQPGDLAFFPDNSHIGIVVARNPDGTLMVCHCSSGKNNVVITEARATGFTAIGRPKIYT